MVNDAWENVCIAFGRTDFEGITSGEKNTQSYISADIAGRIQRVAKSKGVGPLIQRRTDNGSLLPQHTIFWGPIVIENWAGFNETREKLVSEEHNSAICRAKQELKKHLYHIKQNNSFPKSLRDPAQAILDLLDKEEHDEANEFRTIKILRSPNTWIVVPAEYQLWSAKKQSGESIWLSIDEAQDWHEQLAATLGTGKPIPALAKYKSFPWIAAVGDVSPLNLDVVFDDRYFMVSNELNLLNTLLLSQTQAYED